LEGGQEIQAKKIEWHPSRINLQSHLLLVNPTLSGSSATAWIIRMHFRSHIWVWLKG